MGGIIHISNIAAAIPRKMGHRDRDRLYSVWSNSAAVQELHCTMDHGTDKTEIAENQRSRDDMIPENIPFCRFSGMPEKRMQITTLSRSVFC